MNKEKKEVPLYQYNNMSLKRVRSVMTCTNARERERERGAGQTINSMNSTTCSLFLSLRLWEVCPTFKDAVKIYLKKTVLAAAAAVARESQ